MSIVLCSRFITQSRLAKSSENCSYFTALFDPFKCVTFNTSASLFIFFIDPAALATLPVWNLSSFCRFNQTWVLTNLYIDKRKVQEKADFNKHFKCKITFMLKDKYIQQEIKKIYLQIWTSLNILSRLIYLLFIFRIIWLM